MTGPGLGTIKNMVDFSETKDNSSGKNGAIYTIIKLAEDIMELHVNNVTKFHNGVFNNSVCTSRINKDKTV